MAFSLLLAAAERLNGTGGALQLLAHTGWELGGALVLGVGLGVPMAYLSGRVRAGEPTLVEAVGMVFLCGGLARQLEVSFLLTAMVMGAVVANFASHHTRPFHAIEGIEWPFMILFFVLAGSSLEFGVLRSAGPLLAVYIGCRIVGRLLGGTLGARASQALPSVERWIAPALLPQAGVAIGMSLLASRRLPELSETLLPIVVAATVLFELGGPVLTRLALLRAGEAGAAPGSD